LEKLDRRVYKVVAILTLKNSIYFIFLFLFSNNEKFMFKETKMFYFSTLWSVNLILLNVEPNSAVFSWQSPLVWVMSRILWVCIIVMLLKALLNGWRSALPRCVTKMFSLFLFFFSFCDFLIYASFPTQDHQRVIFLSINSTQLAQIRHI